MYRLHYALLWLLIADFITILPQSAAAERKMLIPPALHLERSTENLRIVFDQKTKNFLIQYMDNGKPRSIVFEPATKVQVRVEATVRFSLRQGVYTYTYTLHNLANSAQNVQSFIVAYAVAIFAMATPDGWSAGPLSFQPAFDWTDVTPPHLGVAPGTSQGGFSFQAAALHSVESYTNVQPQAAGIFYQNGSLPGLVTCYARGHTPVLAFPSAAPADALSSLPSLLEDAVMGKTVGPVSRPQAFRALEFLATIQVYAQESFTQGWIEDQALVSKYEENLRQIRDALEKNDTTTARRLAGSFLEDVEKSRNNRQITSEAYALLTYNMTYLERRL